MPCVQLKPLNDGDILVFQIKVPEDKTNYKLSFYEFKGLKGTVSNMAYNCLNDGLALKNLKLFLKIFFFHGSWNKDYNKYYIEILYFEQNGKFAVFELSFA